MKIEGKVALVTGGASGIGKALSLRLLKNGIKFVAILDCSVKEGQTTASEFSALLGADRVRFIPCDVTDIEQLQRSFQEAYDVYHALDIVVNNAGILSKDNIQVLNVNLIAVMNSTMIANSLMSKKKRTEKGVIINNASLSGFNVYPGLPIGYTASKHGVVGLTKAFKCSSDDFSQDLRAVAICAGIVATSILFRNEYITPEAAQKMVDEAKTESVLISMSSMIDAFVMAIEDDTLNGALIKVEADSKGPKITVVP